MSAFNITQCYGFVCVIETAANETWSNVVESW